MSLPQKRLSPRRGSASAFDPFNAHPELNQHSSRVLSSTLTIVRVASSQTSPQPISHEPPASPVLGQRRLHRRPGPTANNVSTAPQPAPEPNPQPTRLSFAFSSFSGAGPAPGGPSTGSSRDRIPSPSSSPRLRPSSPRLSLSSSFPSKPRLTPDQLVDLARQSASPRSLAQAASVSPSGPSSPVILSHSPTLSAHTPSFHSQTIAPATFTPLPDDIYLPFVDRPSEVASLISSPPDAKLFTLLAQTFPKGGHEATHPLERPSDLPGDPIDWTYHHLVFHLTKVDRDLAPDTIWTYAARRCIMSRSELIWERVKGALGIPPDLDMDWDFDRDDDGGDSSSVKTDDISDDEGKAARGHWSDWDVTIDSPVIEKGTRRLSLDSVGALAITTDCEPQRITSGASNPPVANEMEPDYHVNIEPLIAAPTSFSNNPPPLSLPSSLSAGPSDGLGDIAEGAEEEEVEGEQSEIKLSDSSDLSKSMTHGDPNLVAPSQIQGLKITTSPLPVAFYDTPPMVSPVSPHASIPGAILAPDPNNRSGPMTYVGSRPHSRTSSFSSIGPFRRTESGSNIAAMLSSLKSGGYASGSDADTSSILSELHIGSDPTAGYRIAGNPLFPSNFARLTGAPTLKTNLRSGLKKPRTYSHGAGGSGGSGPSSSGMNRRSWGAGSVPTTIFAGGDITGTV